MLTSAPAGGILKVAGVGGARCAKKRAVGIQAPCACVGVVIRSLKIFFLL